jgi:hypothetical protein
MTDEAPKTSEPPRRRPTRGAAPPSPSSSAATSAAPPPPPAPSSSSPDAEVQAAARALLARMAPDPWALRFGIAALALLALLVGIYVG